MAESTGSLYFEAGIDASNFESGVNEMQKQIEDFATAANNANKPLSDTEKVVTSVGESAANAGAKASRLSEAFTSMSADVQLQATALQKVNSQIDENVEAQNKLKDALDGNRVTQEMYTEGMKSLQAEYTSLTITKNELSQAVQQEIAMNQMVEGSIDQLKAKLSAQQAEYNKLSDAERKSADVGGKMSKQIQETEKSLAQATVTNKSFVDQLKSAPGPLGAAVGGIQGMVKAAWAFIATPLGAVIAALVIGLKAITSYFKRTEEGQQQLAKVSGYLTGIWEGLLDIGSKLGKALWEAFTNPKKALGDLLDFLKDQVMNRLQAFADMGSAIGKLFSKDWKEGLQDMGSALLKMQTGIDDLDGKVLAAAKNINDKAKERSRISEELFKIKQKELDLSKELSANEIKVSEARYKAYDDSLSEKERLAALKEASAIINSDADKQIALLKEKLDLKKQEYDLNDSDLEARKELVDIENEINNIQTQKNNEQRMLVRQIATLQKKDDKKGVSEEDKSKAIKQAGNIELEAQRKVEQMRLDAMEEGKAKRIAQAQQEYEDELDAIKAKEREQIEAYNTSKGIKKGDTGYVDTLPVEMQSTFDQLRIAAEQKKNRDIVKINDDTVKEIQDIWRQTNDMFRSQQEKDVEAVNDKYDEIIKRAKEAGVSEEGLQVLYAQRLKEQNEIEIGYSLERIALEEEASLLIAEEKFKGVANEFKLEKEKLEIAKRFAIQKLALLKQSGTETSKVEAKQIENEIKNLDKGIKSIATKSLVKGLDDAEEIMNAMAGAAGLVNEELEKQMAAMADIAGNAATFAGNLASGNWVGAVASGLTLITSIAEQFAKVEETLVSSVERTAKLKEMSEDIRTLTTGVISSPAAFSNYLESQKRLINELKLTYKDLSNPIVTDRRNNVSTDRIQYLLDEIEYYRKSLDKNNLSEEQLKLTLERIDKLKDEINEITDTFSDYISSIENLVGFSVSDLSGSVVSGITEGLQLSSSGLGDFADSFQDLLQKAALRAMTVTFESRYMQSLIESFSAALGDGVLTDTEKIDLETQYKEAVEGMQVYFQSWEELFGDMGESAREEGMKGAIKGVTEQTAGLIEGRMNSIQYTIIESKKVIDSQLMTLQEIRNNTSYNRHLRDIAEDVYTTAKEIRLLRDDLAKQETNPTFVL